jgi:hypothetical protein
LEEDYYFDLGKACLLAGRLEEALSALKLAASSCEEALEYPVVHVQASTG